MVRHSSFMLITLVLMHTKLKVCSTETLSQGEFLLSMGLQERVKKLVKTAEDAERKTLIEGGASRLVDPKGMGGQYKVMGIVSKNEGQNVWPFKSLFGTA